MCHHEKIDELQEQLVDVNKDISASDTINEKLHQKRISILNEIERLNQEHIKEQQNT